MCWKKSYDHFYKLLPVSSSERFWPVRGYGIGVNSTKLTHFPLWQWSGYHVSKGASLNYWLLPKSAEYNRTTGPVSHSIITWNQKWINDCRCYLGIPWIVMSRSTSWQVFENVVLSSCLEAQILDMTILLVNRACSICLPYVDNLTSVTLASDVDHTRLSAVKTYKADFISNQYMLTYHLFLHSRLFHALSATENQKKKKFYSLSQDGVQHGPFFQSPF